MSITYHTENNIGYIDFDHPDSKVNILTNDAMKQLEGVLDKLKDATSPSVLIFQSRKKDIFIAGADIKEIEGITESKDGEEKSRVGQEIFNKLEDLKIPTIAVIDGVALGGGCELALACTYRLATFNEKVKIGLPEVNLGILPGFGGTYRLPRLLSLPKALKMILTGKPVSSKEALRMGLVDRLVPQEGLDQSIMAFVNEIQDKNKKLRIKRKPKRSFLEKIGIGKYLILGVARKGVLSKTKGFYPAPLQALNVIKKSLFFNREKSLSCETEGFGKLVVTDISKNLIKVFYLMEKFKKSVPEEVKDVPPVAITRCGIVGAGIMGGGIAQLLSDKDIWVRLLDINFQALGHGLKTAAKIYKQAVKRRRLKRAQADRKFAQITTTLEYQGFGRLEAVIEAVAENMAIKQKVFKKLNDVIDPETILLTNTSALSVTEMAQVTTDPTKVIGFHFFNPVHRMPLVEIIPTEKTSAQTLSTALGLAKKIGKTPIVVKDSCGFLVNRILLGYINEAGRILEDVKDIAAIDGVMREFGMPMGPFLLSDEVGSDVGVKVLQTLEQGLGPRFKPCKIFEQVTAAGFLGKKSGKGFYTHGKRNAPNAEIVKMLSGAAHSEWNKEEGLKRMVYIMINEAARCLEGKIVDGPDAVDLGMIMGTGFPAFRGGLLRYADTIGLDKITADLNRFSKEYGADQFQPCGYLATLSDQGKNFYD